MYINVDGGGVISSRVENTTQSEMSKFYSDGMKIIHVLEKCVYNNLICFTNTLYMNLL